MIEAILFDKEEKYIADFLCLPKKLYGKRDIMQNESVERQILLETHVLNKYFRERKILVYRDNEVAARGILTIYHESDVAYIGYFECIRDKECAKALFDKAAEIAAEEKMRCIQGPVDSSFWIKYRLKVDLFDRRPYTDEPYNKDYYKEFFEENGYQVIHTYSSKQYGKVELHDFALEKARYEEALQKGYQFVSPTPENYFEALHDVYDLVMDLYNDFPAFSYVEWEDFREIFKDFKSILDFKLVKIVYYEGKAVAFSMGVPDYQNLVYGKLGFFKILGILKRKKKSKNYVLLYMGVRPEHRGLGRPLVYEMSEFVKSKGSTAIGALQGEGKKTNEYARDKIEELYHYCLYEREL